MQQKSRPPTTARDFFISYTQADQAWAQWIAWTLEEAGRTVLIQAWDIRPGENFVSRMQQAASSCGQTVIVLSADFLRSGFTEAEWTAAFAQDPRGAARKLIPVRVGECEPPGLLRPIVHVDLVGKSKDDARAALLGMLAERAKPDVEPAFPGPVPSGQRAVPGIAAFPGPGPRLEIGRLPTPGREFVGRLDELALLDTAWADPHQHLFAIVAWGGVGKSALVHHWLRGMEQGDWRGAERVYGWSFYSQGTEDRLASAEGFLDAALRWFGEPQPEALSPRDRGLRLAALVRQRPTLLVLDGVEPLQHPPGPLEGRFKDPGMAALIKELAGENGGGLVVVSTREPLAEAASAGRLDLEKLAPADGAELLRRLGVTGTEQELRAACAELGGHALALSLLGTYLRRAFGGDVRKLGEAGLGEADRRQGGHAFRVMAAYERWLGVESTEVAILRLVGLFDRPPESGAVAALRKAPAIEGLTDTLVDLAEPDWNWSATSLRELGLLLPEDPHDKAALDAHPLVRTYFGERLEKERPAAWREGHARVYAHLCAAAEERPSTLEGLLPLYAAIGHGCRAGRRQEALYEVFWRRIRRGNEAFSVRKLGCFSTELSALAGFFTRPWDRPAAEFEAADQAFLLNAAGFYLRALGRLTEAVEPMRAGLEARIVEENWKQAAISAGNLSELTLTLGDVGRAVAYGEESVELADRSGDAAQRMSKRTAWADALHQAGRPEESARAFGEAERMQAEWQPQYPLLYSLPGYRYCDLLLSTLENAGQAADSEDIVQRASRTLEWFEKAGIDILSIALDHLTLGRAHDLLGRAEEAAEHLDRAVAVLRQAGTEHNLPWGLLARATFRRRQDLDPTADLREAQDLAERGAMRLHLCDAHLEWARHLQATGDLAAARQRLAEARRLVGETGYGRRRGEVEGLGVELG